MAMVTFPFDHFHMSGVDEFTSALRQAGYDLPVSEDTGTLRAPFTVSGRRFENSMAIQPLEGLDGCPDGAPSQLTLARYEKLAAQGAAILWVEATAVCPEGRDSTRQLWLHQGSLEGFRQLTRTIDESAAKAGHRPPYKVLQLTHSGRCSVDAAGRPAPLAAFASPYLDPLMGKARIVTDDELDRLQKEVAETAALACAAGFDAVDLKLCHQYLFKELLCAYTRPGRYGGSQENRFRFALGAVDQIRRQVGSRLDIAVRLNAYDGIPWPYGWGMAPSAEGAPKNVLPVVGAADVPGHATVTEGSAAGIVSREEDAVNTAPWPDPVKGNNWPGNPLYGQLPIGGSSNWPGNPDYRQASAQTSNWSGNPDYRQASAQTSNWSGNPAPLQISEDEKSSWQGNPNRAQLASEGTSNWSGNPAPLRISEDEKSSWQGNPNRAQLASEGTSNWPGNPDYRQAPAKNGSNWPGNPEFLPAACRNCTAPAEACASCAVRQPADTTFAVPPMPGPMRIDLTEVKELMTQLYRRGVRIFDLTTTSPRFAPSGNGYLDNFSETAKVDPFAGEMALLQATKEIRQAMPPDVKIVGTGLSWFGPYSANVAAGGISGDWFDIAGFGRSVMTDNSFISSILRGDRPDPARACVGCDSCFRLFFADLPTGCPMQHRAYEEIFRQLGS